MPESNEQTEGALAEVARADLLAASTGVPTPKVKPPKAEGCKKCDGPGGAKTFANQACLPIAGKVQCIDWCIHQIVAALNAGGLETVASCCGHGTQDGRIDLKDGRILKITRTDPNIVKIDRSYE